MSQVDPTSPAGIYEKLKFTWDWYANPYFGKKPVCQETKQQDSSRLERCTLPNTTVTKGTIDKGYTHLGHKEPDSFYEKVVWLDAKPYVVQALWRVVVNRWWYDTSSYDLKIFNSEGGLIEGPPDFIQKALDALCPAPATKKIEFQNIHGETCEDLPAKPAEKKPKDEELRTCVY